MISIAMPYWKRQALLTHSLERYREVYPAVDLEIVIAADGCPVDAPGCKVVELPAKDHALNPCVPINRAVEASSGDIIVLTNPEIEHRQPVLLQMLEALESEDHYVIAACWNNGRRDGYWVAHSSCRAGQGGRLPMPEGSGFHFCTMLHRSLWEKAGGFDEEYRNGAGCDDNDWLWRLEDAGAIFVMRDDLVVYHQRTDIRWPRGGLPTNRRLLKSKWRYKWEVSRGNP